MKRVHIVNPYNSTAMQRMINPLLAELPKLYEVTTSTEVDHIADLNFHAPWHTMTGLEKQGVSRHVIMYTHCNPPDIERLADACERADIIVCMSYAGRQELVEMSVDPKKLWVNYAAADPFQFRKRLILVVGYPQPNARKREHILLDLAWQMDMSAFQFALIGNGWENTQTQLQSLGVSIVTLFANDDGLREAYNRADCLLVTGYIEGGPLPLLEAMASGVPVFSPRFGYAADLLADEFIYDTIEDLRDKLGDMVSQGVYHHRLVRAWGWLDYAAECAFLFGRLLGESVDLYPERGMSRYAQILDVMDEIKPRRICEIGTWNGNRALQMIQTAAKYRPMKQIYYQGFDLFGQQTGEQYRRELSKIGLPADIVRCRLRATGANIKLIEGDTNDVLNSNIGFQHDFVFIDGGHSEETIRNDANAVLQLFQFSPGVVVIFDDYYHAGKPEGMGCNTIIDGLGTEYEIEHLPVRTFTEDGREIGMVKVKRANIPIQRQTAQTLDNSRNDGEPGNTMSYVWTGYAPRPAPGDGELERLASPSGE